MKLYQMMTAATLVMATLAVQAAPRKANTSILPHDATAQERQQIESLRANETPRFYNNTTPDWKPVVDTTDFKYVLLSSEADFSEAAQLRYTIAKNLPEGVKLVLLVDNYDLDQVKQIYSNYISLDRVIFAVSSNISNGFWARDSFPYPVTDSQNKLSLVGFKYYRNFTAGNTIANALRLNMSNNNFTFVGGNLLADENGVCFAVDSYRRFTSTDQDLYNVYGCRSLHIMQHYSGIGDVDEVLKPLGHGVVLTNTPEYADDLKSWGYQVVMLPAVPDSYRTYVNSLIVGKTVFMPTYGVSTDQQAQEVYEGLGYKVVGIRSNTLSDQMHGSIHCQTMAYPQIPEAQLLNSLGLRRVLN